MTDYNPSVRQIPRDQHAAIIPERGDSSILRWLESTGRLIPREVVETKIGDADGEEISDLMGDSDNSFDDAESNTTPAAAAADDDDDDDDDDD